MGFVVIMAFRTLSIKWMPNSCRAVRLVNF